MGSGACPVEDFEPLTLPACVFMVAPSNSPSDNDDPSNRSPAIEVIAAILAWIQIQKCSRLGPGLGLEIGADCSAVQMTL